MVRRPAAEVDPIRAKPLTEPHVVCTECGLHRNKAYAERGAPCVACGTIYKKPQPKVKPAPAEPKPKVKAPKQPTQRQQKAEANAKLASIFRSVK
jgi:ribosomal protein L37E